MSFEIRIAERVADTIRRLKPRIREEVLRGIEDAGIDTSKHVRVTAGPCAGRPCYWFRISMPPKIVKVACVFLYAQDEESLYVIALGILEDDCVRLPSGMFR